MTVNYLMASSDGGQRSITSWFLVMTVNYLMVSSDDGLLVMAVNYLMVSSDGGQLPRGFLVMTVYLPHGI